MYTQSLDTLRRYPCQRLDLSHYSVNQMQNTNEVGLCGTTWRKAAKAVSKSMTNLDETGLEVVGCSLKGS